MRTVSIHTESAKTSFDGDTKYEEALCFIEGLDPGIKFIIETDDDFLSLDSLQHCAYDEAQVYCDVCGLHYHPEDPCIYH